MIKFYTLIMGMFLLLGPLALHAATLTPEQENRAVALGDEIRCTVCQAQTINGSNADMAQELRHLIRMRIAGGDSDAQIRDYLRTRYGDFILLRPPFELDTYILWLLPGVLLVSGGIFIVYFIRARAKGAQPMIFWILAAILTAATAGTVLFPLFKPGLGMAWPRLRLILLALLPILALGLYLFLGNPLLAN